MKLTIDDSQKFTTSLTFSGLVTDEVGEVMERYFHIFKEFQHQKFIDADGDECHKSPIKLEV